jgi:chromosome segregation ATPase
MQQEAAQAKELAESLTQEKAAIESQLTEKDTQIAALTDEKAALETSVAEKDAAIDQLTADHAAAITAKDAELNGIKASLTTAENTLAERDQTISDLNAQIEELQNEPGEGAQVEGPASNGTSAEQPKVVVGRYVYDNSLTYQQNLEAEERWNKEHGK